MILNFDPLSILSIILMQIGARYLSFNITKAQETIIKNNITQFLIYTSIIYLSTKNFLITFIIVSISYILLKVLLNENNKHNIYPIKWLIDNNLIDNGEIQSKKELYINNLKYHHE